MKDNINNNTNTSLDKPIKRGKGRPKSGKTPKTPLERMRATKDRRQAEITRITGTGDLTNFSSQILARALLDNIMHAEAKDDLKFTNSRILAELSKRYN